MLIIALPDFSNLLLLMHSTLLSMIIEVVIALHTICYCSILLALQWLPVSRYPPLHYFSPSLTIVKRHLYLYLFCLLTQSTYNISHGLTCRCLGRTKVIPVRLASSCFKQYPKSLFLQPSQKESNANPIKVTDTTYADIGKDTHKLYLPSPEKESSQTGSDF